MLTDPEPPDLSQILDNGTDETIVRRQVSEYCRINLANLDEALQRQPSLFAYASACFEMAKVNEAKAKWDMEVALSQAFQVFMDQDSKMTVGAAEKKMKSVPSVQEAVRVYHQAMQLCARLKGLTNGLEHRRDMLVQLSARERQERANN